MSSSPSNAGVLVLDYALRPYELLSGWRPAARTLTLPAHQPALKGQRVHARISVLGLGVATTITGRASTVRPVDLELELDPDETRVRALERLVEVAGGARGAYQPRAPRYRTSMPAVVYGLSGPTFMTTLTVSENGCGLAWTGSTPDIGVPLEIRLGAGRRVANFCGEVCWTAPTGRPPAVGVQFAAGDRVTWTHILDELERVGTPHD
jgi:hypothetical protein